MQTHRNNSLGITGSTLRAITTSTEQFDDAKKQGLPQVSISHDFEFGLGEPGFKASILLQLFTVSWHCRNLRSYNVTARFQDKFARHLLPHRIS